MPAASPELLKIAEKSAEAPRALPGHSVSHSFDSKLDSDL